jgi:hypothetical protein
MYMQQHTRTLLHSTHSHTRTLLHTLPTHKDTAPHIHTITQLHSLPTHTRTLLHTHTLTQLHTRHPHTRTLLPTHKDTAAHTRDTAPHAAVQTHNLSSSCSTHPLLLSHSSDPICFPRPNFVVPPRASPSPRFKAYFNPSLSLILHLYIRGATVRAPKP